MWSKLSVVLLASFAFAFAPHASADPNDGMFLIALDNGGVPYGDPTETISWGHTVCDFMDEGKTMNRATLVFQQAMGWSVDDAGYFVGAAARLYCPWNIPPEMLN